MTTLKNFVLSCVSDKDTSGKLSKTILEGSLKIQRLRFGLPLDEAFKDGVPVQLMDLLVYIARNGVATADIFRRPGNPTDVKHVCQQMSEARDVDFQHYNFFTLASVLKRFLLKIPGGVFGRENELKLLHTLHGNNNIIKFDTIRNIITSLPQTTQTFLTLLFGIWFRMTEHSNINSMSCESVAKSVTGSMFVSCSSDPELVLLSSRVVSFIIKYFASPSLFGAHNLNIFTVVTNTSLHVVEYFKYQLDPACLSLCSPSPRHLKRINDNNNNNNDNNNNKNDSSINNKNDSSINNKNDSSINNKNDSSINKDDNNSVVNDNYKNQNSINESMLTHKNDTGIGDVTNIEGGEEGGGVNGGKKEEDEVDGDVCGRGEVDETGGGGEVGEEGGEKTNGESPYTLTLEECMGVFERLVADDCNKRGLDHSHGIPLDDYTACKEDNSNDVIFNRFSLTSSLPTPQAPPRHSKQQRMSPSVTSNQNASNLLPPTNHTSDLSSMASYLSAPEICKCLDVEQLSKSLNRAESIYHKQMIRLKFRENWFLQKPSQWHQSLPRSSTCRFKLPTTLMSNSYSFDVYYNDAADNKSPQDKTESTLVQQKSSDSAATILSNNFNKCGSPQCRLQQHSIPQHPTTHHPPSPQTITKLSSEDSIHKTSDYNSTFCSTLDSNKTCKNTTSQQHTTQQQYPPQPCNLNIYHTSPSQTTKRSVAFQHMPTLTVTNSSQSSFFSRCFKIHHTFPQGTACQSSDDVRAE